VQLNATRMNPKSASITQAFSPARGDLLRVGSTRRGFLQTGLAGLAGVSMPSLLQTQALAAATGKAKSKTNVILFWLSGGPSHIDMWDPKPDAPSEIRGPFGHISTKEPGIHVCEHLPLTAKIMDKLTLIRSVDCSASNHTPITMQACNPLAKRTNDGRDGGGWPSMGSIAAKFRGANAPGIPGYVALADSLPADIWGAGHMGGDFEPVSGKDLAGRLKLSEGLTIERLGNRRMNNDADWPDAGHLACILAGGIARDGSHQQEVGRGMDRRDERLADPAGHAGKNDADRGCGHAVNLSRIRCSSGNRAKATCGIISSMPWVVA
jgi:hypothetical protein